MKIVCDSCGAKYSIADEKVAGKTFKIRCKRCSSPIMVHGEALVAAGETSTALAGSGDAAAGEAAGASAGAAFPDPNAVWHAVVQGEQQGPMTVQALEALVRNGSLDGEGYVWREGFEGWLPAKDVPELAEVLGGGAGAAPVDPFGATAAAAPAAEAGGPAYAGAAFSSPGGESGTPLASRATRDDGADLFAPADPATNPFAASGVSNDDSGVDDDVIASAPSRPTGASRPNLTGQRNENSVLFSLQNLQALAGSPGDAGGGAAPAVAAGTGTAARASGSGGGGAAYAPSSGSSAGGGGLTEGSGLIDIRALASATSALGGAEGQKSDGKRVDDLLSIGGASPGLGASSLGSPVLAPAAEPDKGNRTTLVVAILGGFGLLAAAVVAVAFLMRPEPQPTAQLTAPPGSAPGDGSPGSTQVAGAPAEDGADEEEGSAEASGDNAEADGAEGDDGEASEGSTSGSSSSSRRARSGRSRRGRDDADDRGGASSSASASSGSSRSGSRRGNDIDDLLNGALGGGSKRSGGGGQAAAAPAENLPETPSREQVARALRSVEGAVRSCGQGQSGVAMTQVTVDGSSGRVTNARVQGQFAGTPEGSCIARAVRRARFPRFKRPSFQVTFPYRL